MGGYKSAKWFNRNWRRNYNSAICTKYNQKIIILKLGGSIITEKLSAQPRLRKLVVRQLAKELKMFTRRFPEVKIILLHGAGSFGHRLVYRHKLFEQTLTGPRLLGFAETVCSTRQMANLLTKVFRDAKLPVLPLQASAVLNEKNNAFFNGNHAFACFS